MTVRFAIAPLVQAIAKYSGAGVPGRRALFALLIFLAGTLTAAAQPSATPFANENLYLPSDSTGGADSSDNIDDDEIAVVLTVRQIGSCEVSAVIQKEEAYLSVKEVFSFLKIRVSPTSTSDSVTGFFMTPENIYSINKLTNQIIYGGKVIQLKSNDLLRTESNLYLRSSYFNDVFGLECQFNFRNLSIALNTKLALPAIREMEAERMRQNIKSLQGHRQADTTIAQAYPLFSIGSLDWSVLNTNISGRKNDTRLDLNFGAIVAGGETNVLLVHNTSMPFQWNRQSLRWRYVNNKNQWLRQAVVGNVATNTTATLFGFMRGFQLTNAPTTLRTSFGTYRLSDKTQPGWTVELYINNVLVNYTKADASGFFTFDVPLVYGFSAVRLRYFGPWGEELTKDQNLNVPFNFLPKREFEYNLTAGVVADGENTRFSRLNLGYGLSNSVTIGGGLEYMGTPASQQLVPFVNASLRMGAALILTGEHSYGVRSRGLLKYQSPSSLQFEASYAKYEKGQILVRQSKQVALFNDERRLTFFAPLRLKSINAFSRLTYNQLRTTTLTYTTAEALLSGSVGKLSVNATTSAVITDPKNAPVFTDFSLGFRLPYGINITPQLRYGWSEKQVSMFRTQVDRSLFKRGFLNIIYERGIQQKSNTVSLGLRYNFSFARTALFAVKSPQSFYTAQAVSGSLLFNDQTRYIRASDQFGQGRGGIVFVSFLDLNDNGKRDAGEPKVKGLKLQINGGQLEHSNKDSCVSIRNLEAYNTYFVKLDENSFEEIGWHLKNKTLNITVEPNRYKLVEVPVRVLGEVAGKVFLSEENGSTGLGKILINFYSKTGVFVGRTMSEADGYFSFAGLPTGEYIAKIDTEQLTNLGMKAMPAEQAFSIRMGREGDLVENLRFTLEVIDRNLAKEPVKK